MPDGKNTENDDYSLEPMSHYVTDDFDIMPMNEHVINKYFLTNEEEKDIHVYNDDPNN